MVHSNRVLSYDPVADTWHREPDLLTARSKHNMVEWRGRLIVIGGNVNTIEMFNPSTGVWTLSKQQINVWFTTGATIVDGEVYIVGRVTRKSLDCGVFTYFPDEDRLELRVADCRRIETRGRACCTLSISDPDDVCDGNCCN